ncbi:DNA polymerase IV [Halalkalibacter sp. APA_J-10(15)]|uniref:DNA polymerase IV n=1 Tax=Halalkalibacter sp. APA_J-10(15) TaxID=2933805 RepID=UPI001FF4EDAD|nr:DNA polymerase IV [Halalkalibacter sp. APA_J-10(15)]MCK0471473.1 DNA polymerase IV [Halalkalibacter sp. APA_J-10(15)]
MLARIIFHLDMNSFFASVEVAKDPTLSGKPLAIAGNPKERKGIIVTSTYEARAKGVKTTMPIWQAKKLCPELIVLPPNGDSYRKASQAIFNILFSYTPNVQQVSIDEGYMDVTDMTDIHPVSLAKQIQKRIFDELRLPCSIGIAPNKFLAKMASDMKKPNGITIVRKRDVSQVLWPMPIEEMHGIGRKTVEKWKKTSIHTIGDLAVADKELLAKKFGDRGLKLQERANGIDHRKVDPNAYSQFKSIGHSKTLHADTANRELINETFSKLAVQVQHRLHAKKVCAYGVQITIRYFNWKMITRSKKLVDPIQSEQDLLMEAKRMFDHAWNGERVRLLGISTYDLIDQQYAYRQLDLFSYKEDEKMERLQQTIKHLRKKFGDGSVQKGYRKKINDDNYH